jgi:DNA (cytosine-5)-methyltransferase 1
VNALYNEIDPFSAEWLRNLNAAGRIPAGVIDTRDIRTLSAGDLANRKQAHFFAGIGGWPAALRLAGWPDECPVWTGSCPCQPFSTAGKKKGFDDDRHLWPTWFRLIEQCKPPVIFGEQVANKDALQWLDLVSTDLEAAGYSFGAVDLSAAGVGAPHIRQRLYFVAISNDRSTAAQLRPLIDSRVADATGDRRREERSLPGRNAERNQAQGRRAGFVPRGNAGKLGHADGSGPQVGSGKTVGRRAIRIEGQAAAQTGVVSGYWADADLIYCQDGKYRPVEPSTFPLAHGVTNRVGRLRATGNAIVLPLAEQFIRSVADIIVGIRY